MVRAWDRFTTEQPLSSRQSENPKAPVVRWVLDDGLPLANFLSAKRRGCITSLII